jgi:hypothetical protein
MTLAHETSGRKPRPAGRSRLIAVAASAASLVVLAACAAELISYGSHLDVPALDAGSDGGMFGVLVDVAVAAAAASAWVAAARVRAPRRAATVLAVLLTFLAADQVFRLHDSIPHWLVFYLPVLLVACACLIVVARDARRGEQGHSGARGAASDRYIIAGLLLLAVSLLLHLFGERLLTSLHAGSPSGWGYQVKAVIKHATEAEGWVVVALGLFQAGLVSRRHRPGPARPAAPRVVGRPPV